MNWLPPNGALDGVTLDHLLRWNLAATFWLFVAAQILLVAALLWRLRPSKAEPASGAPDRPGRVFFIGEMLVLVAVTALYIAMDFTGHQLWAARREAGPFDHPIQVEVTGVQFQWYFRYPGSDGAYGRIRPALVSAPNGNPLGLDPADAHSRDDIVSSILVLPVGRPVDLRLRSQDVIHGLFIPGMRLKQDAIPGMIGHLQFTPTALGDYVILCSQVCGLGHARMQARLRVESQPDYDRWIAGREKSLVADASGGRP
ncbi:MAG TPA: cytochrome C oxidase subunit II [Acidobacteriaceae bacterium]